MKALILRVTSPVVGQGREMDVAPRVLKAWVKVACATHKIRYPGRAPSCGSCPFTVFERKSSNGGEIAGCSALFEQLQPAK